MFQTRLLFFVFFLFISISSAAKTISLEPNETKALTNHYLWTYHANCNLQDNDSKTNKIAIKVLKNRGTVNGTTLSSGQSKIIDIKHNSNISVTAESGTEINLINLSGHNLKANCSI